MDLGYFEFSLPVADIGASMAFYEALGFEREEYAWDAANATLVLGDCRLDLFQGHLDPDLSQLNFRQGDILAMAERVRRAGLGFHRGPDGDGGQGSFTLLDPDGHPLFFIIMPDHHAGCNAQPGLRRAGDPTACNSPKTKLPQSAG